MMQLHLTMEGYGLTEQHGYTAQLQPTENPDVDLAQTPWVWHGRHRKIFDRNIWIFIEADSQFCLCFFDMKPRELKQLDLTLWQRFVSEYAFMSNKENLELGLTLADEFLSVVRNWMAPLSLSVQESNMIDTRADYIFDQIQTFLKRPRPIALPTQDEMEFSWRINTDLRPEKNENQSRSQENHEAYNKLFKLIQSPVSEVIDFPKDKQRKNDFQEDDDISIMEFIHQQLKTNVLSYVSPAILFAYRISHMLSAGQIKYGQVLQFQPRG